MPVDTPAAMKVGLPILLPLGACRSVVFIKRL